MWMSRLSQRRCDVAAVAPRNSGASAISRVEWQDNDNVTVAASADDVSHWHSNRRMVTIYTTIEIFTSQHGESRAGCRQHRATAGAYHVR